MLQVARLARKVLGDSTPLVAEFLRSQQQPQGGFGDREGKRDLYYTVFGMEGLIALEQSLPWERLVEFLLEYGEGEKLDLVHLSCLIRCWADLPLSFRTRQPTQGLLRRLQSFRAVQGGYGLSPRALTGSIYGCFMAVAAFQDLNQPVPDPEQVVDFVIGLRDANGGFANGQDLPVALVPSTAAAVCLLHELAPERLDERMARWLLSCRHPQGGFRSHPETLLPDLLSTATALHALAVMHADLQQCQEPCLDFLDSLWNARGGFCGHWEDGHLDCEYTYYGLLSLGHLSF
jgi:prenyltransferase beta subunit